MPIYEPSEPELFNDYVPQMPKFEAPKKSKTNRKEDDLQKYAKIEADVKFLLEKMATALELDIISNQDKKPAIKRLRMLDDIDNALMKDDYHETFTNMNGSYVLSQWLMPLPDGSYPNAKIVHTILRCINRLNIRKDEIGEKEYHELESYVEMYKAGSGGASHKDCQSLARNILNSWYRHRDNVEMRYDEGIGFDKGWR